MRSLKLFSALSLFFLIISASIVNAQLVSPDPYFVIESDAVVITFDATQGSGGLAGYTGDVYVHTGVITSNSTGPGDWKYVVSNWGQNTPETKLTNIGPDLYTLNIGPTIRDFYGVPAGETILQIALVFRSDVAVGANYLEGKTAEGGDIFVDLYEPGLNIAITYPEQADMIVELNDIIQINVSAIFNDSISLYIENTLLAETAGQSLQYTLTASDYAQKTVTAYAWNTTDQVVDSFIYFVRPPVVIEEIPAGMKPGINYIDNQTVLLSLYAPEKEFAFVIGSFNDWAIDTTNYMKRTPDGKTYWLQINNVIPGQEYIYQYWVDGEVKVADPYAEKISDPWNDQYITNDTYPDLIQYPFEHISFPAAVFQTNQEEYVWTNTSFTPPAKEDLVVYELLIRDFTAERNVQTLIDTLGYLEALGINAIELMPVNEFEGNLSWGYNPDFYFAFDKYYGPKNEYKRFIDECHSRGIAVIMDIALNHSFGLSPLVQLYWDGANNQPAANNPWYNQQPTHDYNVGFDFNHESQDTKNFVDRVVKFWIEEYKIDGYRFDLSKGFTQNVTLGNVGAWGNYDASRIAIWKAISDSIWSVDPDSYVILEHFANNDEEKVLADYGMMIWGNLNHRYRDAAMGYADNDVTWGLYTERGWNEPNLITYMESHDEERMNYSNLTWGNINGDYSVKDPETALKRCELAATFFLTLPGPKMIWQFGEYGYDVNIDFNGRTGIKPLKWQYLEDNAHLRLFQVYQALINLKNTQDVFKTTNISHTLNGYYKRINLTHATMSVTIIGNFNVIEGSVNPQFQYPGKWYDFFSGDSIVVTNVSAPIQLAPGEYKLYTSKKLSGPDLWTDIDELEYAGECDVYPNPSNDRFNFVIPGTGNEDLNIKIYSTHGQLVKSITKSNLSGMSEVVWDGKSETGIDLAPGMYFARISYGKKAYFSKLVKQ